MFHGCLLVDANYAAAVLRRPRLIDQVGSARQVTIEAPAGYGKSTLLDELCGDGLCVAVDCRGDRSGDDRFAARLVEAAGRAGVAIELPADLVEPVARAERAITELLQRLPSSATVAIDDAHHLRAESQLLVGAHLGSPTSTAPRLIVVARDLGQIAPCTTHLTADDLAFDLGETEAVLDHPGDEQLAARCRRETRGWPAATALWRAAAPRVKQATIGALIDRLLTSLSSAQRAVLADYPLLDDRVGELLGWPTLLTDVRACGLPLRRVDTWWVVGDVIREHLRTVTPTADRAAPRGSTPVYERAVTIATWYARAGRLIDAIDLAVGDGGPRALVELFSALDVDAFELADLQEIASLLLATPDNERAAHPAATFVVAEACELRAFVALRAQLLDRLETLQPDLDRLRVERVRDLATSGDIDQARERGKALLARLPTDQPTLRARCLYAVGTASSMTDDPSMLLEAAQCFAESAGLARAAGQRDDRARALSALAYRVHVARGEYVRAIARFEEALALIHPNTRLWAATLTFLAEAQIAIGRASEAMESLAAARGTARDLGDVRLIAYCAWAAAKVAAQQRNRDALARWLAETDANRGDWYEHLTGAEFFAVASELSAQCGDEAAARHWLARCLDHPRLPVYPDIAWPAECSMATRFGDPADAVRQIERLLAEGYTQHSERWRYQLWLAWNRHRLGDLSGTGRHLAAMREMVVALGHPTLPQIHEPEMIAALHAAGPSPSPTDQPEPWRIALLGGFAVRHGDTEVSIPSGKPQALVKLLALRGAPIPVEELADLLWPDVDGDLGRQRLRNVVRRVRASADILQRADELLALEPGVAVDVADFESLARTALRSTDDTRAAALIHALARYRGELLPADRYEDWAAAPRERARGLAVRVGEAIADEAGQRGDVDQAVEALERLCDLDPYNDRWPSRAAQLLRDARRPDSATMWEERARLVRRDLGLE